MAVGGASLHEHAVQAEEHLEQLATGLAKAGADEAAVETVTKMATVVRQIVKVLGKGQEETGDDAPPAPQPERPHTMDTATADLHRDAQAAAARRAY